MPEMEEGQEAEKPPISITELVQLSNLGISQQHVTWSRVTMTSDLHICIRYEERHAVRDRATLQKQLMVVSLRREGGSPRTWPMSPESAMVSPPPRGQLNTPSSGDTARIAIKSGDSVLVLKVTDGWETLAKCEVHRVQYWTWLSYSVLALVSDRCVYHWNIDEGGIPEKVFTRHQRLMFTEIVGYKVDEDLKWFALTGLAPQDDSISGITQLYSVENRLTQCISAHAVTFVKHKFEGNMTSSTVLCVACRDPATRGFGKVHIIELGPHSIGNMAPSNHYDHIKFVEDDEKYDFPVSLQVTSSIGLLYVITKYGQMYVCDMESGSCLFAACISTSIVFTTVLNTATQGILGVTRSGQVLAVDLKLDRLPSYVRYVARKASAANRLEHITGVTKKPPLSPPDGGAEKYSPDGACPQKTLIPPTVSVTHHSTDVT